MQLGGQSSERIIAEFMMSEKQLLVEQMLYLGIASLVLTVVVVLLVVKNYRHVKAIPKLEPFLDEEKEIVQHLEI